MGQVDNTNKQYRLQVLEQTPFGGIQYGHVLAEGTRSECVARLTEWANKKMKAPAIYTLQFFEKKKRERDWDALLTAEGDDEDA